MAYRYRPFDYVTPPALAGGPEPCHDLVIVGAGPVGLAMAIDLAQRGVASVVLDDGDTVSVGSRAICWAKRTLEIFDRLGVARRMVDKGVTWQVGRNYRGDREVWSFDLLPEDGHAMPAFINLQQYYVEEYLIDRCRYFPDLIDLRFKNRLTGLKQDGEGVALAVETPDGDYDLPCRFLLACDGARSTVRERLGLEFDGELFEERFLIADIEMKADFPSERRFWFEPTFHAGQSALLHKQPDDIYRIDLQLGWDADPEAERQTENVIPRIRRVVGDRPFEIDWVSVYTFQCRRMARFVHDRVIFVGDSAHIVSPFGARGGNGGIQDVDNLGWKLAAVLGGTAGPGLLESYDAERTVAADQNILNSARTTRFMTPKSALEHRFRTAVLDLAGATPFARPMVNSGRLSRPCVLDTSPLNGADDPTLPALACPGAVAPDAPTDDCWLLNRLGPGFTVLALNGEAPGVPGTTTLRLSAAGALAERYLGNADSAVYLIRPDQHVAARWRTVAADEVENAVRHAWGF